MDRNQPAFRDGGVVVPIGEYMMIMRDQTATKVKCAEMMIAVEAAKSETNNLIYNHRITVQELVNKAEAATMRAETAEWKLKKMQKELEAARVHNQQMSYTQRARSNDFQNYYNQNVFKDFQHWVDE